MKLASILFSFAVPCMAAVVSTELIIVSSATIEPPAPTTLALARRLDCEDFANIVLSIGTSQAWVVYGTLSAVTSLSICQLLHNHGVGGIGADDCTSIAGLMGSTVGIIFYTHDVYLSSADPMYTTATTDNSRVLSLASRVRGTLSRAGHKFDDVTSIDVPMSDDSGPQMRDHAKVSNLQLNGTSVDVYFADFGDGDGHVRFGPAARQNGLKDRDSLQPGPGFKVSFTARLPSQLNQQHVQDMSYSIANSWASYADKDNIANLMGFVKTDHTANFYWRIIPESNSYGLNYESVNICGGMGQYL